MIWVHIAAKPIMKKSLSYCAILVAIAGLCCGQSVVTFDTFRGYSLQHQDWAVGGGLKTAVAFAFSPSQSGMVTDVDVSVYQMGSSTDMIIQLWSGNNGGFGSLLETVHSTAGIPANNAFLNSPTDPVSIAMTGTTLIEAGNTYWLRITPGEGNFSVGWALTGAPLTLSMQLANTATSDPAVQQVNTPGGFTVFVAPVPEPSACAVVCGLAALGSIFFVKRKNSNTR